MILTADSEETLMAEIKPPINTIKGLGFHINSVSNEKVRAAFCFSFVRLGFFLLGLISVVICGCLEWFGLISKGKNLCVLVIGISRLEYS